MFQKTLTTLIASSLLCLVFGCSPQKSTVVTTETSKIGKEWAQTKSTQQYRTPDGKLVKEKQSVDEKITCVGKKGKKLPIYNPDECLEQGGKIVDEVTTTEVEVVR